MLSAMFAVAQQNNTNGNEVASNSGSYRTVTGTVTCAARLNHQYTCRRYDTLQSCTLNCVQAGSKYALAVDGASYLLQGDPKALERFAGGKATVSGSLIANEIQVGSVTEPGQVPFRTEEPVTSAGR
jgi:hypothetical protein